MDEKEQCPWMVFLHLYQSDYYFQVHEVPKYEGLRALKLEMELSFQNNSFSIITTDISTTTTTTTLAPITTTLAEEGMLFVMYYKSSFSV